MLRAARYLPEVWQPDEAMERLRRLVARRAGIVQGMTRTKPYPFGAASQLIPPYQGKLFMAPGWKWLAEQPLAEDERQKRTPIKTAKPVIATIDPAKHLLLLM